MTDALPETTYQDQGNRLRQLRKQHGLSAEQLAQKMQAGGAKVSRGAISNWERGINGIVSSKLPILAHILGVSEGYLIRGDDAHTPVQPLQQPAGVDQPQPLSSSSAFIKDTQHMTTSCTPKPIKKSDKLQNVCYDIRGPLLKTAMQMEADGQRIIKLNVGNPAPFGLDAPHEILQDISLNLTKAEGYSDSQGIFSARKAILQYYQAQGLLSAVDVRDVYLGNGVSELIVMTMQALMNDGDEVLIPMPDYPLWTAAATLAGGTPVHYRCDESKNWQPDIADIKAKITPKTRGIVIINPNNPTGAVYGDEVLKQIVELAREHDLIIMADEIYDRVLYDDVIHTPMCTLASDVLVLSYNGLSKSHRIAGFRAGWMMISGDKTHAADFIEGLDMLASMRLCANVPAQYAIQTALGGHQSMQEMTQTGGRLHAQRRLAVDRLNAMPGVSCTEPQGAFYCFPKLDNAVYPITDDMAFMMDLLKQEKILIVQGSGFNWERPDHFRVVFLPNIVDLTEAMDRLERFLQNKRKAFKTGEFAA